VADTLSRHPIETANEICATDAESRGRWYRRIYSDVQKNPEEFPDYRVHDRTLFRRILHSLNKDDAGEEWKICVPTDKREQILRENHSAPTAGHLGITKAIARLARLYYWPGVPRRGKICQKLRDMHELQNFAKGSTGKNVLFKFSN